MPKIKNFEMGTKKGRLEVAEETTIDKISRYVPVDEDGDKIEKSARYGRHEAIIIKYTKEAHDFVNNIVESFNILEKKLKEFVGTEEHLLKSIEQKQKLLK